MLGLSEIAKMRSRFIRVISKDENRWDIVVYDSELRNKRKLNTYMARNIVDVRRVVRAWMGQYSVPQQLVTTDSEDIAKSDRIITLVDGYASQEENVEAPKEENVEAKEPSDEGDNDDDKVDEEAPDLHGDGEEVLER